MIRAIVNLFRRVARCMRWQKQIEREIPKLSRPIDVSGNIGRMYKAQGVRRNDFCPCNSGRKFKKCCGKGI